MTQAAIQTLVIDCRRRFVGAAMLVGAQSEAISKLSALGIDQNFDLDALQPVWWYVCQRYMAERFSAQLFLFEPDEPRVRCEWNQYVYGEAFPALFREDVVVRNVHRSIGALPTESPRDAVLANYHFMKEMDLPSSPAPWAPEKDIK